MLIKLSTYHLCPVDGGIVILTDPNNRDQVMNVPSSNALYLLILSPMTTPVNMSKTHISITHKKSHLFCKHRFSYFSILNTNNWQLHHSQQETRKFMHMCF